MNVMSAQMDRNLKVTRVFSIFNKLGLHARPAAAFVNTAKKFACDIVVQKDSEKVNGKSVIGLLLLAAGHGSQLTVHADGHDASLALAELGTLFERGFGEKGPQ
jgi:phosphocarrier protein